MINAWMIRWPEPEVCHRNEKQILMPDEITFERYLMG